MNQIYKNCWEGIPKGANYYVTKFIGSDKIEWGDI